MNTAPVRRFPSSEEYRYTSLKTPASIRLCILELGEGEEIRCSLETHDLEGTARPYTALSYTWDPPTKDCDVICDDRRLSVTSSLYSALRRLRLLQRRVLWIDALCIDQSGDNAALKEKGQQVQMMYRIFPGAVEVIADLGEMNDGDEAALDLIETLWDRSQEATSEDSALLRRLDGAVRAHGAAFVRFFELILRRWFTRLWVVQEFALAKTVQMMVGTRLLDPEAFFGSHLIIHKCRHMVLSALDQNDRRIVATEQSIRASSLLVALSAVRIAKRNHENFELSRLINMTRFFNATEPKDYLYALRGLASDGEAIEVDYEHTDNVKVYTQAATHIVTSGRAFDRLLPMAGGVNRLQSKGAPSWVPDYSKRVVEGIFLVAESDFSASTSPTGRAVFDEETLRLRLDGAVVDMIEECTSVWDTRDIEEAGGILRNIAQFVGWMEEALKLAAKYPSAGGLGLSPQVSVAFYETLVGGRFKGKRELWDVSSDFRSCLSSFQEVFERLRSIDVEHDPAAVSQLNQDMKEHFMGYQWFKKAITAAVLGMKLCVTEKHRLGLVSPLTAEEDSVAVISGCKTPFILHGKEDSTYTLQGACYVHGIMDGEALKDPDFKEIALILR